MNTNYTLLLLIPGFFLGLAVGSFLNVVIYRVPAGKSVVKPRSSCPECGHMITWYENIPLISYIFLRGRCSSCGRRISLRYPVIELLGGILGSFCLYYSGWSIDFIFTFTFTMSLLAIAMIDWDHQIIPDVISLPFIVIGILWAVVGNRISLINSLSGAIAGGGSLYLTGFIYKRLRKVDGMGGGDVKLMAMIGAFLGIRFVLPVILVASLFGAVYGIFLMRRGETGQAAVPFGSFLAPAGILCLFFGDFILRWYFLQFR